MDNPYQTPGSDPTKPEIRIAHTKPSGLETLFSFSGRVPRKIYWGALLLVLFVWCAILGTVFGIDGHQEPSTIDLLVMMVLFVPLIWISLAINAKRWHDCSRSGWMILVGVIPLIGQLWIFIECGCMRGTPGPNQYGPDSIK